MAGSIAQDLFGCSFVFGKENKARCREQQLELQKNKFEHQQAMAGITGSRSFESAARGVGAAAGAPFGAWRGTGDWAKPPPPPSPYAGDYYGAPMGLPSLGGISPAYLALGGGAALLLFALWARNRS